MDGGEDDGCCARGNGKYGGCLDTYAFVRFETKIGGGRIGKCYICGRNGCRGYYCLKKHRR